jgi:ubiquinone/menaquinone biosynthesis C-methylase UbiE
MTSDDLALLVCLGCEGTLHFDGERELDGRLCSGVVACRRCDREWAVADGVIHLYDPAEIRLSDRIFRFLYDRIAPVHDLGVRYALPIVQWSLEGPLRDGYMRRIALGSLRPHADGTPVRILEVGIGSGANLALIARDLPPGLDVEIWGVDLSGNMLAQCRARLARGGVPPARTFLADAHALPFRAGTFDRVFHAGAIANYGDPRRALAEMARVARPDTPIVVVDEQLDPRAPVVQRALFRTLLFWDPWVHAPREHLPVDAYGVIEEQVSVYYYCLTFQVPPRASALRDAGDGTMDGAKAAARTR